MYISKKDKKHLRDLAKKYLEIASSDTMSEIIAAWYSHAELQKKRPIILFESKPMRKEYVRNLECEGEFARTIEMDFLRNLWHFHHVKDDHPLMPYYSIKWEIPFLQFGGIKIEQKKATDAQGGQLAHIAQSPIRNLETDLAMLKRLDFFVDRELTYKKKDALNECFGDILPAVIRGKSFWTMGLTFDAINLIGLESLYMGMYDHPAELHELLRFLMEEKLRFIQFMEDGDMLTLNNEADYYASGSYGFTCDLPQKDFTGHVRSKDIAVLLESQETSNVSPDQYKEFVFPYYNEISKHFGALYYGCCEPVEKIWHLVKQYHNLKAVSISPWCNQEEMAANLKSDYIYSRKPMPTLISTETFDEDAIKKDLEYTIRTASGCELELIMKDVHSVNHAHNRMGRWVALARQAVEKYYG